MWRYNGSWTEVAGSTIDTQANIVTANSTRLRTFAPLADSPVAYRVNAGGSELAALDDNISWAADTQNDPSPYTNAGEADSKTYSTSDSITLDSSVPDSTPPELFQSERWDAESGTNMQWDFPVDANATYEIRLYFAEIYFEQNNQREFDVTLEAEDTIVLDDYDIHADVGDDVGVMKAFRITPDSNLDIDFYREKDNPKVSGFELIKTTNNTNNDAPTANFTYSPDSPATGETITFNGSVSDDSDGNITSYEWDFDGDGTIDKTGQEATYTYSTTGTKRVVLTVTDDDGAANLVSKPINVSSS